MDPLDILQAVSAGFCFYAGITHLLIGLRSRPLNRVHLSFAAVSILFGVYSVGLFFLYEAFNTGSLDDYVFTDRWGLATFYLALSGLFYFIEVYTGSGKRSKIGNIILWSIIGLYALIALLCFILPYPWVYTDIELTSMFPPDIVIAPWYSVEQVFTFLLIAVYSGYHIVKQFRHGERNASRALGLAVGVFLVTVLWDYAIEYGLIQSVLMQQYGFVAFIVIMSLRLSNQAIETERKYRNLAVELEERVDQRTEELRINEAMLRAQYEGIPIPTYTWQASGNDFTLVNYNEAAATITGGKVGDYMGARASEMYRDRPDIIEDLSLCLQEERSFEREIEYQFRSIEDSKHLAVKYAFVPPDLVLVHTEDITERKRTQETLRRRLAELSALNRIAQVVAMAGDLQDTLEISAKITAELLGARATLFTLPENENAELQVLAGFEEHTGTFATTDRAYPLNEMPITRRALASGETEIIPNLQALPLPNPARNQVVALGLNVLMLTPLKVRGEVIGLMAIGLDRPGRTFTSEEIAMAETIAGDIAAAIENARLTEQTRRAAVDAERQRLARELHDSVTQSLYSLTLMSSGWGSMARQGTLEDPASSFDQLGAIAQQALKGMRLLIHQLRPSILDEVGLLGALQARLDVVELRSNMESRLLIQGDVDNLPQDLEEQLFNIAQEALNNSLRHADASEVIVKIQVDERGVVLSVEDDGKGFDPGEDSAGLGLVTMRERAESIGGDLAITSTPLGGAKVVVSAPLDADIQ